MGRVVYWMNVSLDLRVQAPDGPHGGDDWVTIDEQLHRAFNARARELAVMIQGRVMYEIMSPFWPDARDDQTLPDYLREFGDIWTSVPKVLVSRTRTSAGDNTRAIGATGDAIAELAQLRRDTDGRIGVGGVDIATQMLRAGLIDELLLFTHPVVLGAGRPLFDETTGPLRLALIEQTRFDGGVTMHRYDVLSA
ncbi:dihydrofolate reductase family protein [Microbacterium sp. MC2]